MFSISKVASFAFLALATVASAAGRDHRRISRATSVSSLPTILTDATNQLTPLVAELTYITEANATSAAIQPIAQSISTVLSNAISDINALSGQSSQVALGSVDVKGVASLLGGVINLVFSSLGSVLSIVGSSDADVYSLLAAVGSLAGQLVQAIVPALGGLTGSLVITNTIPLVGDALRIVGGLNLTDLLKTLAVL